ncbi:hypothetical protein HPB51_001983 [Rhipicephalus microplus]|uniref:Amine oxidase n=1 Tax=Rhipicephalus microplus TaxID=6941 RepID=A0A9J6EW38_RHIMP|nr:hypothetical protein HPB51_001983 [Rhipicephalus microplus]
MVGWVDLGGSYVGPTQNHILRLANELQVDTYKIFDDLKLLHFSEGKAYPYETTWAHFGLNDPLAWFDINYVMRRMDIMMEQVPAVDPWNCPHAEEWDAMTLQSFFEKESWTKFAIGDKALRLQELPKQVRPKVIAADLARAFEHEAAYNPVHFEEKNWLEEQYSGGCYVSTFPTGVMSKYGKTLREPFGRVYFAGTETATAWPGYMNGAVQAGERAAREVLCAMKILRKDEIWEEEPEFKGVKARPFEMSFLERHPPHVLLVGATGAVAASSVACVGVKAQPFEMSFLERHPPHVLLVGATGAVAASSVACVVGYCVWKAVTAMRSS